MAESTHDLELGATTQDAFFDGRVQVVQPRQGFRAGTDSILLATALPADLKGEALELGCGAGGALLPAAYRLSDCRFIGLERDRQMVELARRGVALNGFDTRVSLQAGDVAKLPELWQNRFDLVFSNPPFFEAGKIQAPAPGKPAAYVESVTLKHWLQAMLFALRPKASLILIHRASELARILALIERQCGEICIQPIHSYPGQDAKRILVRARKGLRPGALRLLDPLYLYEARGGERTQWALNMQRQGAGLDWG